MKKKPKFKDGHWYSLCRPCLKKCGNDACCDAHDGDDFKCYICGKKAKIEFYPGLKKIVKEIDIKKLVRRKI